MHVHTHIYTYLRISHVAPKVCARLYRTRCPWLLVFDNLNERSLLDPHL